MSKLKLYVNFLTAFISLIVPKKKNRWVFGAWFGDKINDNPWAFYQYVSHNHPEIEAVWITKDPSIAPSGVTAFRRGSMRSVWMCLTAKVAVMNQCYLDLEDFNWIKHSFKVQLLHGVAWKKFGEDIESGNSGILHRISHSVYLYFNKYDLYLAPCEEMVKTDMSSLLAPADRIIRAGQPRNERLMDAESCRKDREKLASLVGEHRVYILYMPTFRDKTSQSFGFVSVLDEIGELLKEHDAIILEKQHYVDSGRGARTDDYDEMAIDVTSMDAQELLAACDILVTDYSSCFFDFILTDRPIIHYIYDYEYYRDDDRGLYYDRDYAAAGICVFNRDELIKALRDILEGRDDYAGRRELIRSRFAEYESPENSEKIFNVIISEIG